MQKNVWPAVQVIPLIPLLTIVPIVACQYVLLILTTTSKTMFVCFIVLVTPLPTLLLGRGIALLCVLLGCSVILCRGGAMLHVLWVIGLRISLMTVYKCA